MRTLLSASEETLSKPFPPCELPVISATIKMFTDPKLIGDQTLLRSIRDEEALSKNERLYNLGVGEKDLASADTFASLLEQEGVEVAYKPGKLKPIPALAKTDDFMQELLSHENERVRDLAQARLDVKSTINETRSGRMLAMAARGPLAVYLHYAGAHTRRWSGGDALNFQNLGRAGGLRTALRAPVGYLFANPDLSQIECRMLNWLGGQEDVVDRFRRGDDPYLPMASLIYGEAVTDKKDPRRQTGKIAELQLGFGSGVKKFQSSAKRAGIDMPDDLAQRTVDRYRASHGKVVSLWREATSLLGELATGKTHRPWRILMVDGHCLVHPNGSWLDYSSLAWKEGEWRLYGRRGAWRRMYGSALVENVVQWLARIVAAEAMVRIERAGYPVVGMAHDDLWILVPENAAQRAPQVLVAIMSEMPSWAGGLPLAAECKIGKTYA